LGLAELLGQVEAMVEESGSPEGFDAGAWLTNWLRRPVQALGGAKPIEYLDTIKGQMLVAKLLLQMQTGAYA
ncbi:MbcA/ParS/Xre antitoxin family protein, partial [Sphingomonas sp.]|uniref:MbcA/ParS/Xre antitoxin family protein n=1 Tax=Sphingomonas sp. TaxID=28214 RepID=UPI0025DD3D00